MYLTRFILPSEVDEERFISEKMVENGGKDFGYVDNLYPCRSFPEKQLDQ